MKRLSWRLSSKLAAGFLLVVITAVSVGTAFGWEVYPSFGHSARYGGEAESGNLGGERHITADQRYTPALRV